MSLKYAKVAIPEHVWTAVLVSERFLLATAFFCTNLGEFSRLQAVAGVHDVTVEDEGVVSGYGCWLIE